MSRFAMLAKIINDDDDGRNVFPVISVKRQSLKSLNPRICQAFGKKCYIFERYRSCLSELTTDILLL